MYKKILNSFFPKKNSNEDCISKKYSNLSYYQNNRSYFFNYGNCNYNSRDYKNLYTKNVIAFSVINLIAKSVSSIEIKLFEYFPDGAKEIKSHPLLKLLKRPEPLSVGIDLIEQVIFNILINGNAYVLKVWGNNDNFPKELIVLNNDRVKILTDSNGYICGYQYEISSDNSIIYEVDNETGASDVMHFKNFNPLDDKHGLSPFEAALGSIEQHESASTWNRCLLKNSARPSGALISKSGTFFTEEQYKRLREQIDDMYSGQNNSGRPMLIEGGLEWKEMGMKPKDMEFISVKNNAAREIALAFGVPPYLLGIPGDNTYSNLSEAREAFLSYKVLPMIRKIVNVLNAFIIPERMSNLFLDYDLSSSNIFDSNKDKILSKIEDLSFMTINEKRRFFDLPPIKEGDVFKN